MRLPSPLTALLLLPTTSLVLSLSLANFQPIVSFPAACTTAYDTQFTACTSQDFSDGNACSQDCINDILAISIKVNTACVGTRANPSTLIGLIFQGQGVATLCPNSAQGSGGDSSAIGQSTIASSASTVQSSVAAATSQSTTTTKASATAAASTSSRSSASSTKSSPSSSSSPSTTTSTTLRGASTSTAANTNAVTVVSSKPKQTASSDNSDNGGGGSPFEVTDNGAATTVLPLRLVESLLLAFVVGVVIVLP